jgi:hypothetical protein
MVNIDHFERVDASARWGVAMRSDAPAATQGRQGRRTRLERNRLNLVDVASGDRPAAEESPYGDCARRRRRA